MPVQGKDKYEWDKLFDEFVSCGEDWSKSELVLRSVSEREQTRRGRWKTMSRLESLSINLYHQIGLVIVDHTIETNNSVGYKHWSEDLLERYAHDPLLVDDLIARKTEQGLYESNPDFPLREEIHD